MTVRYTADCCPACGSYDVLPYAVIVGGSEEYGYQCLACEVTWPVLTHQTSSSGASHRNRALRESTDGKREGTEEERQAGASPCGRSSSPSSARLTQPRIAGSRR